MVLEKCKFEVLFVFIDQLQGISELLEADRKITTFKFDEIDSSIGIEVFIGFKDSKSLKTIRHFQKRSLKGRIQETGI